MNRQNLDAACQTISRQHNIAADYEKTLALLRALKAGELTLDDIELHADGWRLVDTAIPAVIAERNGLPAEAR